MGPTNVALVKLYRADQQLRAAQERYDTAARSVRILERRVNDLTTQLNTLQHTLKNSRPAPSNLELDLKSREERIEKLRSQQQQSKTNKEYQVFLSEINTEKVDRNKVEEQAIEALELVERTQGEVKTLAAQLEEETLKFNDTKAKQSGPTR